MLVRKSGAMAARDCISALTLLCFISSIYDESKHTILRRMQEEVVQTSINHHVIVSNSLPTPEWLLCILSTSELRVLRHTSHEQNVKNVWTSEEHLFLKKKGNKSEIINSQNCMEKVMIRLSKIFFSASVEQNHMHWKRVNSLMDIHKNKGKWETIILDHWISSTTKLLQVKCFNNFFSQSQISMQLQSLTLP